MISAPDPAIPKLATSRGIKNVYEAERKLEIIRGRG